MSSETRIGVDPLLEDVEIRQSDDPVKTDLEVVCPRCDEVICDVEHGDSLGLLARTILSHMDDPEQCTATEPAETP